MKATDQPADYITNRPIHVPVFIAAPSGNMFTYQAAIYPTNRPAPIDNSPILYPVIQWPDIWSRKRLHSTSYMYMNTIVIESILEATGKPIAIRSHTIICNHVSYNTTRYHGCGWCITWCHRCWLLLRSFFVHSLFFLFIFIEKELQLNCLFDRKGFEGHSFVVALLLIK